MDFTELVYKAVWLVFFIMEQRRKIQKKPFLQRIRYYVICITPRKCKPFIRYWTGMDFLLVKSVFLLVLSDINLKNKGRAFGYVKDLVIPNYYLIPMYDDSFCKKNWNIIQSIVFGKKEKFRPILLYRKISPTQLFSLMEYVGGKHNYALKLLNNEEKFSIVYNELKKFYLQDNLLLNGKGHAIDGSITKNTSLTKKRVVYTKNQAIVFKKPHNISFFSRFKPNIQMKSFLDMNKNTSSGFIQQSNGKRVAYVIPGLAISGGIIVILEHCFRLIKRGYNVSLISISENYDDLDWFGENYIKVDTPSSLKEIPDIAVATHWSTVCYVRSLSCSRKVYFVQSDETRFSDDPIIKNQIRETYFQSFEYITEAKWIQEWLSTNFDQTSLYVPNAINPSFFYPSSPIEPKGSKIRVLLEGAINVERKGMVDAFNSIDDLDCEVWCVSNDGQPKEGMRCDRFFENVPFYQMKDIYSSCDILLKMSRVEGFYGPPLEMMACGGLVVTAKVTGYDEYIVDKENALVVEPRDTEGAKRAIQTLMENRDLCNHLLKNGAITVEKWNDWEKTIDILESFYFG